MTRSLVSLRRRKGSGALKEEIGIKTIPIEKKCKKSKMAVWGSLTNSCEKKRSEKQRRKGKISI